MNFVHGKIVTNEECDQILVHLEEMILKTLEKPPLDINLVIRACDYLVKNIDSLEIINKLSELGISPVLIDMYYKQLEEMLSAQAIKKRICLELGEDYNKSKKLHYIHSQQTTNQTIAPLGVLFHITAGNVDGLPFISLLEGLLTGNINIVKLPKEEGGITVSLLEQLFKIEPSLQEYVYVFNYSSKDLEAMQTLAKVSDAIVVWGGDEAVRAIRRLADPNTKIIEWGHKISFAYLTKEGYDEKSLEKLALHICLTNQLFCSSCQGIFIDTNNSEDIYDFCRRFLPVFDRVAKNNPLYFNEETKLFIQAEISLQKYHLKIENQKNNKKLFEGENCTIIAALDSQLEPSIMYRNIWVKPLTKDKILTLRSYKSYLQTVALLCSPQEYQDLSQKLIKAGVVKVSDGLEMSNYANGEAHDGIYTLRCYTKLVSVQNYN